MPPTASADNDPAEVHAGHSFEFVQGALRAAGRRRAGILEVGCGRGQLARRLTAAGHRVTAIDSAGPAVQAARRIGVPAVHTDFLEFDGGPFDAVVFVLSLHHVGSLARAVRNVERLLKPGGLLIADEFGRERIDRATAAWFFDGIDLLEAAGLLSSEDPGPYRGPKHGATQRKQRGASAAARAAEDPLLRWRHRHMQTRTIHSGRSMVTAVDRRLKIERLEAGAHLFRYSGRRLKRGATGARVARYLLEAESALISESWLRATGLRIVARRPYAA